MKMTATLMMLALLGPGAHAFSTAMPRPLLYQTSSLVLQSSRHKQPQAVANYAGAAAGLFANMGGASAFIAGGLVPLTTFAAPMPSDGDSPVTAKLKKAHCIVAAFSLVNLLCSVMYSTITFNKLQETAVVATTSLKELLLDGDFALPWVGLNSHFILGLCGFAATTGLNVWLSYGGAIGKAVGCLVASALLIMISIVNDAVATRAGGALGLRVGGSILSLFSTYASLMLRSIVQGRRVLVLAAVVLGVASVLFGVKALAGDADA